MSALRRLSGWFDERLGWSKAILPVIQHPVPPGVNWWYVLGSATLVAFTVQVVTGVALAFTYVPAPNSAYSTLEFITNTATLGYIVRGIHYWGASAMVVLIFAHAIRVFLTGSFKYPRELNWFTGVGLLLLTLGMAFTGQLLRWDQNAYWAIVIGAEQVGRVPWIGHWLAELLFAGQTIGGATLTRFYATHVFLIPALMFLLIGVHLYLVVHHGISEPPVPGRVIPRESYKQWYDELLQREGIPFWPDAAWRDVIFALAIGTVVLILAIVLGPVQLAGNANPTIILANPRPDWEFIWYYAFLSLIPPTIENVFIIGFPIVAIIGFLIVPIVASSGERSPRRRPWAVVIVLLSVVSVAVMARKGEIAPWSPRFLPPEVATSKLPPLSAQANEGRLLFNQMACHDCHTIAGTGGLRGPNLTSIGDRLTPDQLTWRILNGGYNMPAYGTILSPSQVQNLVAFLSALKVSSQTASGSP